MLKKKLVTFYKTYRKQLKLNYYKCYTIWFLFWGFFFGSIISSVNEFPLLDGIFLAISAMTCTGLSTIEMTSLTNGTFVCLAILMILGGTVFLLLPPMIYRRICYRKVTKGNNPHSSQQYLSEATRTNQLKLYDAIGVGIRVILLYHLLWNLFGMFILYCIFTQYPSDEELVVRQISTGQRAVFDAISAYANAGITISSSSMSTLSGRPLAYLWLCALILAGNTGAPIALRGLTAGLFKISHLFNLSYTEHLKYILDHPRRITTHMFDLKETKFLFTMLLIINAVEYLLFLMSMLNGGSAKSNLILAGDGIFQTISTRCAGFSIVSLRDMNEGSGGICFCLSFVCNEFSQILCYLCDFLWSHFKILIICCLLGMIVIYVIAMYLSSAPFVSRLYSTNEDSSIVGNGTVTDTQNKNNKKSVMRDFTKLYLVHHTATIVIAFVVAAFVESSILKSKDMDVGLWGLLFEIASAYGNVGLSLGVNNSTASLSCDFSPLGKCIIIFIMLLGKHRGWPKPSDTVLDFMFKRVNFNDEVSSGDTEGTSMKDVNMSMLVDKYNTLRKDVHDVYDEFEDEMIDEVVDQMEVTDDLFVQGANSLQRDSLSILNPLFRHHNADDTVVHVK